MSLFSLWLILIFLHRSGRCELELRALLILRSKTIELLLFGSLSIHLGLMVLNLSVMLGEVEFVTVAIPILVQQVLRKVLLRLLMTVIFHLLLLLLRGSTLSEDRWVLGVVPKWGQFIHGL